MAMDKDTRNQRRREKYKAARDAGLSRSQTRSVKKAIAAEPSLAESVGSIFTGLMKDVAEALEAGAKELLKETKQPRRGNVKPTGKGAAKSGGGKGKSSAPKSRKGGSGSPPDFERFAAARGHLPANEIIRQYRKAGGSIGNEKGKRIIREVFRAPKQLEKKTRLKYLKASDRTWKVGGQKIQKTNRHKSGYAYITKYKAVRAGFAEPETMYVTITSDTMLTISEVKDSLFQMFDDLANDGKDQYVMEEILEDSIEVLYAIDNSK